MKTKSYLLVRVLIEREYIKTFSEIFEVIAKTRVSKDVGINIKKLNHLIKSPEKISRGDIEQLCKRIGVRKHLVGKIIRTQIENTERKSKSNARNLH